MEPGHRRRLRPLDGPAAATRSRSSQRGRVQASLARDLGLVKEPHVLIGGNDAVLAAYSVGFNEPGQVINVNGTCEITLVCLPKCLPSQSYNIRAHVLPDRWLTLYVMNAGGKALEWFKASSAAR